MNLTKVRRLNFSGREVSLALLIVLVTIGVTIVKRDAFFNIKNFEAILIGLTYDLLLALGMTMVLILGGIDLSVGSVLAFVGVITTLALQGMVPTPVAILIGLLAAALIGALNGLTIVKLRIPPFVMTLGMMSLLRGTCYVLTSGYFINKLPENYINIGRGSMLGVPNNVVISLVILLITAIVAQKSKIIKQMFFIGESRRAAFLSGIPTETLTILGYVLCSFYTGIAGILMTSRLAMGHAGFGIGAEARVIAAAVIGGASLYGGKGSMVGTFLGVIVIALLNNAFIMFNGSPNWQTAISGVALIIAMTIDVLKNRYKKRTPAG